MRKPSSTYRLQVTEDFDLVEATRRLPYLHALGVDWVYLSPLLQAEPGSQHGYDVVAHDRVDESRGGAEGLAALAAEARRLGLGVLVDIVPNHVGVATPAHNAWWWDLLQHGRGSTYADAFDVDWDAGGGRIRLPVVGDDDRSPEGGPIANLRVQDGELRYHDHRFPLAPGSLDAGADDYDPNAVHDRQHYELVNWRVADAGLNYRRFFAVNSLAGIRVEEPRVLDASHVEIRRWFDEELVDGLRVDHPDGLRDPKGYLADLADITGGAYVLVEKILEPGEELPTSWATAGTTGYDALAYVDRVLTDPAGQAPLDALEERLRGGAVDWHAMIHDTKRAVADGSLNSEVNRIVREAVASPGFEARAPERPHTSTTDVASPGFEARAPERPHTSTTEQLVDAVAELLACFPVYRSYLPEGLEHLDQALELAREQRPDLASTFDVLAPVLGDPASAPAQRFQQTSGMVMAKGVEDCAFYRWSRLTSLNEVGGDPSVFSVPVDGFHEWGALRQEQWPHAMTALSTHDTKRSEDVRARITVLAELPEVWEEALDRLLELAPLPDAGFGSLLWQAVVGAWPAERQRLHAYAEKAMREAGDRTTWTSPDEEYEAAVHAAVDAAYDDERVTALLDGLVDRLAGPGWSNGLAAKLIALTMPGVPDVYQGSELWEQSLVDPDNRRFVDFDARIDLLGALDEGAAPVLTDRPDDPGSAKLLVTHRALTLRRDHPELFTGYTPLDASGAAADHVIAFDRGGAVTVATRLPVGLAARGGWGDTTLGLPAGRWRDLLTGRDLDLDSGGAVRLADVLASLPVALLAPADLTDEETT